MLGEHAFDCDHVRRVLGEPPFESGFHLEQPMCHVQVRAGAHDPNRDEGGGPPNSAVHHADAAAGEAGIYAQNAFFLEHQFGL